MYINIGVAIGLDSNMKVEWEGEEKVMGWGSYWLTKNQKKWPLKSSTLDPYSWKKIIKTQFPPEEPTTMWLCGCTAIS